MEIASSKDVKIILHPFNRGKGSALKTGFRYFLEQKSKWILTIDADLQHDPKKIPTFFKHAAEDYFDVVIGSRLQNSKAMPLDRRFSNFISSFIISLVTKQRILDSQCGYRLMRREMIIDLDRLPGERYEFETECLLEWSRRGAKFGWISIPTQYDGAPSSIRRFRDILYFTRAVIRYVLF